MEIKDPKGKYILKVDKDRRLVYETLKGYWRLEDMERFHNDYVSKIIPLFNGKEWAKCCYINAYEAAMITDDIKSHVKWAVSNGFRKAAMILEGNNQYNSVIDLQIRLAVKNTKLHLEKFESINEADKWLKSEGF
ncbi:hypothetical protein [Thermohalobacter berrensis]|uniref:STAS/SEC14 domain-containing protein n=1 Tax=Thermohalobacter berrensis TaxID=99594 RepID=A0A419T7N7_9FIRM|nr:hypothetical protein [Thermohalobacter berrensis]RKD33455.1 hypothetical protein BET03_09395 [Thermohalobacter berrensis]